MERGSNKLNDRKKGEKQRNRKIELTKSKLATLYMHKCKTNGYNPELFKVNGKREGSSKTNVKVKRQKQQG